MSLLRRFRAPLIGIAALVVSASVAFAAAPTTPGAASLAKAASHAGRSVPVTPTADQTGGEDEAGDTEDTTDTGETGSSDHCNVDLSQDASVLAGLNHGSVVCTAAHQDPPAGYSPTGFANHGAWVSSFAKGSHGSNHSATGKSHKPSN